MIVAYEELLEQVRSYPNSTKYEYVQFNAKRRENPTIDQCFLKVGQDIFNDDLAPFNKYMATLSEITLYKTLIEAQTRADLADEPQADSRRRRTY